MLQSAPRVTETPPPGTQEGTASADRGPETPKVPVLPLIDLLILLGWTSLLVGFVVKALSIALSYPLSILGLAPIDFLLVAGVSLLFALSLAARTWVKVHEPRLVARRRLAEYGVDQGEGTAGAERQANAHNGGGSPRRTPEIATSR